MTRTSTRPSQSAASLAGISGKRTRSRGADSRERAMFAHIVMDYFDVFFQAEDGHFFSTTRALFLDSRVDHLHVLGKQGRPYLLLALRALSCLAHVSFPDMEVYARRVE